MTSRCGTGKPLSFFYSAAQGQSVQKSGGHKVQGRDILQGTRRPREALSKGSHCLGTGGAVFKGATPSVEQ
jgi:hypothetical protein